MATGGDPVYTPETANGARLQALLIDEGTRLVRKVFDKEVSKMNPPSLRDQLLQQKSHLEVYLDPSQRNKVYPGGTAVVDSSKDFDLSLLSLLLGRLCHMRPPTTGWGRPPPDEDNSHLAWIIRLRLFRNENYGHITNTALSNTKFKKLWKKLSDILIELGADKDNLFQRKTQTIDSEQAKLYMEKFEKLNQEDNEVKDLLDAWGKEIIRSVEQNAERHISEIKKTRKELWHIERTHGKQHEQQSHKLSKLEKGQTAMTAEQKKQSAEMKRAEKETLNQLRTAVQQQQVLIEGQKLIIGEGHKQSEEIKIAVKKTISEVKEELKGAKPTAEDPTPIFEKLRNHLKYRYRRELARIRPLPWCEDFYLNLDDMFTTLKMVRRNGTKEDTAVTVEDMFQLYNDDVSPKTIRVEGDPGIGKTTLCYKIVYDWSAEKSKFAAKNKSVSFQLVLYIEMRQVPHDATDIKSTIFKQVFPTAYYKHEEEFWDYVECNPEDVLFVLDGLDEMPEETREKLKISDFIRGQIIPDVHVIVTSRPHHCNKQLTSCDRHFVIEGYSQENIESYVNRHPNLDSNSREGMIKQLTENESLHQLTENPLNLAMLCVMWQKDWSDAILPQTLTGLYSLLVLAIIKRYAEKCPGISDVSNLSLEEMPEPIQAKLNHLSHLAWKGIEDDDLNFSGKAVKGVVELGFLTKDLNLANLIQQSFCFQFLHKTFQEHFAAKYLYSLCVTTGEQSSKASNLLKEYVQYKSYQQVLKFLAGLLGTNARCLFEAFHDSLKQTQDERIISLCLECLHECGAGKELVRYVGDVMPRNWDLCQSPIMLLMKYGNHSELLHMTCISSTLSCKTNQFKSNETNMSIHQMLRALGCKKYYTYIKSNEALYGLVHLLYHQAKRHSAQDNPQLSSVSLRLGLYDALHGVCRFLRAVSSTKVFSSLSVKLEVSRHDAIIEEICNLLQSDAYRDLTCDFELNANCTSSSSLDNLSKLLSSVQSETRLNLSSSVYLAENLNVTNQGAFSGAVSTILRLGSKTREWIASVSLYIDCASDTYVPGFASSSLTNIVMTIKQSQYHSPGKLALLFNVENLPLSEKPSVLSQLADISSFLEDSNCIFRVIKFECSCEDGSVVSTSGQPSSTLLQSLAANQSLTEVSFLCDGQDNVAECLCNIFARNRTLQKLEIRFLHPVADETMANIFGSYPVDSQCHIKSFTIVMETRLDSSHTDTTVCKHPSYEQTVRAILYICKNLCEGSALRRISFISCPETVRAKLLKTDKTKDNVSFVIPVCPGSLLKPLTEAIADSQLTVNLGCITWEGHGRINYFYSKKKKHVCSNILINLTSETIVSSEQGLESL